MFLASTFTILSIAVAPDPPQTEINGKAAAPRPEMAAERLNEPIKIDAILSEPCWQSSGLSNFTQRDPTEAAAPTQKTEVWISYDDEAIYVAARMHDSAPDSIVSQLGRRDESLDSDWFTVSFDPLYDRRTGVSFSINPAGSIQDRILYNDDWSDDTWDGVWEGAARIDDQGWVAEMRIPYSQLRFPKRELHVWGVNFKRTIQRRNEGDYFVMVPKKESGFVSHFADLKGIQNIQPPRHIEILPHVVGRAEYVQADAGNPFNDGSKLLRDFGADAKIGLTSNLTLDLTINPDFGQVEVDPAVVNLSAFETFFEEKRPFFIEGSNIFNSFFYGGANNNWGFNWGNPDFFYSRRVGRSPQCSELHSGFVDRPQNTTIFGAAKITGKLGGKWSVGMISALTGREYAKVDSSGARFKDEVEPLTYYNVARLHREFNDGRQALGFLASGAFRDLRTENLRHNLSRRATALGIDGWTFLDKDKAWVITGWAGASRVVGEPEVITALQKAPARYYQRPDADQVEVDTTATSLSGWGGRLALNKQKGNVFVNAAFGIISPGFDTNDAGFHWRSDLINNHLVVGYRWFDPGKVFRRKNFNLAAFRNYNFGGDKIAEGYFLFYNAQFLNYWGIFGNFRYSPESQNQYQTRGGPLMLNPANGGGYFGFYSDSRKPLSTETSFGRSTGSNGYSYWEVSSFLSIKPSSRLRISFGPSFYKENEPAQYVTTIGDALAANTYGARYVFANLEYTSFSMSTRVNWTFTPKLNLQVYLQPLLSTGAYHGFKEFVRPRSYVFNEYGKNGSMLNVMEGEYQIDPDGNGTAAPFTISNPDFNFKSLRGNAVLRWEYSPGSTLYLVWTQERINDIDNPGDFNFRRDFDDLLEADANDIFLVKISYWWNP